MSYLFLENLFQREKFVLSSYKIKNFKKPKKNKKKTILVGFLGGFFGWVFLGGFFWVGFLLPTLPSAWAGCPG